MSLFARMRDYCQEAPELRIFLGEAPRDASGFGALVVGVQVVPLRIDYGAGVDRHYGALHLYSPDQGAAWEEGAAIAQWLRSDCRYRLLDQVILWEKQIDMWLVVLRISEAIGVQ